MFNTEIINILLNVHVITLLAGILLLIIVPQNFRKVIVITTVLITAVSTGIIAAGVFKNSVNLVYNGGYVIGDLAIRIDSLSAWFILIINIISVAGVLFGIGYLKHSKNNAVNILHWILFLLFQSSMLWVCMVQNTLVFLIAWEIMSLSSLMLVMHDHTNPSVIKAGINYFIQMHISVVFLTIAFLWIYFETGTFDFSGIAQFFKTNNNLWLFLIFFAGFGLKAGFWTLHTWLPHAHPAAPSHVSGVMSGVIVKMGIYGIFRIISYLNSDFLLIGNIVLTISLITGLLGIINASVHRDFKKMLAYCTIENIGIIGIGLGLGLIGLGTGKNGLCFLGFGGALLHVLNHSLFKALLFFSSGSVYVQTHTRNMDHLGGIAKYMPQTTILFLIGALSIGGIPPFSGFISEFMIYKGLLNEILSNNISYITLMIIAFAIMSIIGGISILTFTKTFGAIFLGVPRKELKNKPQEVSFIMLFPQYLLVGIILVVSFYPKIVFDQLISILNIYAITPGLENNLEIVTKIGFYSFFFIFLTGFLFALRWFANRKNEKTVNATWGCGYVAPNNRMQYTGKSFSKTFGKLLNFLLIEKKEYSEIHRNEIFPVQRKYESSYHDLYENKVINPLTQQIKRIINYFIFFQNGKVQAYVLYGIVFILIVFLGTILNII